MSYSTTIVIPASQRDALNSELESLGYGPNNLSVPMIGGEIARDEDGNITGTPTHYACHWQASRQAILDIDRLKESVLSKANIHVRAKVGNSTKLSNIEVEETPDIPDPKGTFNAVVGDNIVISHKEFSSGNWGWRAEMFVSSKDFDPGVRAIAIYSDENHTNYLYTTGSFIWDEENNRWVTEWNENNTAKEDIHWAVIFASKQEVAGTLLSSEDKDVAYLKFGIKIDRKERPDIASPWSAGVSYSVNDKVIYIGKTYSCRQAHTSQVGWEPPNVPALWLLV